MPCPRLITFWGCLWVRRMAWAPFPGILTGWLPSWGLLHHTPAFWCLRTLSSFPHQDADPPGCEVPWATLGVASVPPDIFSTLHSPLLSAGFQQIPLLSKLCPSPHCPDPQLSTKVLAVADKEFLQRAALEGSSWGLRGLNPPCQVAHGDPSREQDAFLLSDLPECSER